MGRIRLEWDVETHQIEKSDSEDPETKWARRRNLLRLLLLIGILIGLAVAGLLFLQQRLLEVEGQLDQLMRDTVKAEVAAMRVGDFDTFMNLQRSATNEWLNAQQRMFQDYELLKTTTELKLTGNVLDTQIEGQRGRAIVEEIIDGVPYANVWFYWRYNDGWRHVPPDYTFWGEASTLESDQLVIQYRAVDEQFAQQLNERIAEWLKRGCQLLQCGEIPQMTIEIVTNASEPAFWSNEEEWQLVIQSPYVSSARADFPFEVPLQIQVGTMLAERLVNHKTNNMTVNYPHDVFQLRQAVISYLVEQFVQIDTDSFLMESLVNQYGEDKLAQLVSLFTPVADMTIVQQVVPAPLGQANLDWRDFITWRLTTEDELIARRSEGEWLNLYDTSDESVRVTAYNRYNANAPSQQQVAIAQQVQTAPSGVPQLRMTVRVGSGGTFRDDVVLFNLVNNVWKRAS